MTHMIEIILINDAFNLVLVHRAQPPSASSTTLFEGPYTLSKPIERPYMTINFEIGDQRVDPVIT